MNISQCLKKLSSIIAISMMSLGVNYEALAKNQSSVVRPGVPHQDSVSYFYTGFLTQVGYTSLNKDHPAFIGNNSSRFSSAATVISLFLGRQWMQYFAADLTFEFLFSCPETKRDLLSGQLIKTDLSFYSLGIGLDCVPMLPLFLGKVSLLGVFGIGYKKANIKSGGEGLLDSIPSRVIPRIGVGVLANAEVCSIVVKVLTEFNNRFSDAGQALFRPSLMLGASIAFHFG